jgi:hypothetical protein
MIETLHIGSRDLLRRLKELVDFVSDSDNKIIDPSRYAINYARLINLAKENRERMDTKFIRHNLTPRRYDYILRLLGEYEAE